MKKSVGKIIWAIFITLVSLATIVTAVYIMINGLGLVDMSGNVWEWTSSQRNLSEDSTMGTVKGGSWMDGVMDLRISNYKNIEKSNIYPDVGIRLVKEVSK